MRRIFRALVLLVLLANAGSVRAEEAQPIRPIDRHIPAPASATLFTLEADLVHGGERTGHYSATVAPDDVAYRVSELLRFDDESVGSIRTDVLANAQLFTMGGSYRRANGQGFLQARWRGGTSGPALTIEYKTQEYENEIVAQTQARARTCLGGVLFLAALSPRERAIYHWRDFDPDPPAGDDYVAKARLECHGKGSWRVDDVVRPAWIYSFSRGKRTYRFAFDAETKAFAGLRVVGINMSLAPKGAKRVGLDAGAEDTLLTPTERARRRADAIRSRLPVRGPGWRYDGELLLGEYDIGSARLEMRPTTFEGEPAWLVTERTQRSAGEAVVTSELTAFLGTDLRVLRGESRHSAPEGRTGSTYEREASTIVTRHHNPQGSSAPLVHPAHDQATIGLVSVVAFLAAVPEAPETYVLPGFDPRYVSTPKAGSGRFPQDIADLYVEVKGPSAYSTGTRLTQTISASVSTKTGRRYTVHVDRASRALVAVVGGLPSLTIAPKGTQGQVPDFFDTDRDDPRSAYECFIRFGRGYHLPRRDYLTKAFHWPRMLRHDIRSGAYPQGTPQTTYQKAWIDEFVSRSKHRTIGDCDDLLLQILMTSKESHLPDGGIQIATLPAYGGHVYTIQQVDGRWFITQID